MNFDKLRNKIIISERIMWAAMLNMQAIICFLGYLTVSRATANSVSRDISHVQLQFMGIAFIFALAVLFLLKKLRKADLSITPFVSLGFLPHDPIGSRFPANLFFSSPLNPEEQECINQLVLKRSIRLAAYGLSGSITILGYILTLHSLRLAPMLPFAIGATILVVMLFPRFERS